STSVWMAVVSSPNEQPQNLFLRSEPGVWGSFSNKQGAECIDICIACHYYTEFGINPVIPRNILYRVYGEKPCIIRTCAPITRYNKSTHIIPVPLLRPPSRGKTRYNNGRRL